MPPARIRHSTQYSLSSCRSLSHLCGMSYLRWDMTSAPKQTHMTGYTSSTFLVPTPLCIMNCMCIVSMRPTHKSTRMTLRMAIKCVHACARHARPVSRLLHRSRISYWCQPAHQRTSCRLQTPKRNCRGVAERLVQTAHGGRRQLHDVHKLAMVQPCLQMLNNDQVWSV